MKAEQPHQCTDEVAAKGIARRSRFRERNVEQYKRRRAQRREYESFLCDQCDKGNKRDTQRAVDQAKPRHHSPATVSVRQLFKMKHL